MRRTLDGEVEGDVNRRCHLSVDSTGDDEIDRENDRVSGVQSAWPKPRRCQRRQRDSIASLEMDGVGDEEIDSNSKDIGALSMGSIGDDEVDSDDDSLGSVPMGRVLQL